MARKRQPITHGTYAGARAHRNRGIPLCEPCREAEREHKREYRRKIAAGDHKPAKRTPIECGTRAGYLLHLRREEKACKACRDANAAASREYLETHPEQAEKTRQRVREYNKRPEVRKKHNAWLEEARKTPGTPQYYRARARSLRRSAERRGSDFSHGVTRAGLTGKLAFWGGRCWICRVELDETNLTFDHVKPISKGGVDVISNLRPCCRSCNARKGNKWPLAEVESVRTENERE